MSEKATDAATIYLPDAPAIPGLGFRGFRGEVDYPLMVEVIQGQKEADRLEWTLDPGDTARNYEHLVNSDPWNDMLFAEVDGRLVAYGRASWFRQTDGLWLYQHFAHMLPEVRDTGLRQAMVRWFERRLRQIAEGHTDGDGTPQQAFQAGASDGETHWHAVLEEMGYRPVRYGYSMVRPLSEPIPDLPLPEGVEVRPVGREDLRQIWAAAREAFRDHWGYSEDEWSEQSFLSFSEDPVVRPELFQIAWAGDDVVGSVQNFLNEKENEEYHRLRGWTEGIFVRREWRRKGLARALIARSMRMFEGMGMVETALGVDADNPNGALQLYSGLGYRVTKTYTTYRKPL